MSIAFTCQHCHRAFKAKDELAGKRIKCPGCGQVQKLPSGDVTQPEETRTIATALPAKRFRKALLAGGAALVALAVGLGTWLLIRTGSRPQAGIWDGVITGSARHADFAPQYANEQGKYKLRLWVSQDRKTVERAVIIVNLNPPGAMVTSQLPFHEAPITDGHFVIEDRSGKITGNFTSSSEAEGEVSLVVSYFRGPGSRDGVAHITGTWTAKWGSSPESEAKQQPVSDRDAREREKPAPPLMPEEKDSDRIEPPSPPAVVRPSEEPQRPKETLGVSPSAAVMKELMKKGGNYWSAPEKAPDLDAFGSSGGDRLWIWPADQVMELKASKPKITLSWRIQPGQKPFGADEIKGLAVEFRGRTSGSLFGFAGSVEGIKPDASEGKCEITPGPALADYQGDGELLIYIAGKGRKAASNLLRVKVRITN